MVIYGKLYLTERNHAFLIAFENVKDNLLDLSHESIMCGYIRERLVTKKQILDLSGSVSPAYSHPVKLALPKIFRNNLRIFITPREAMRINRYVSRFFYEIAGSHVIRDAAKKIEIAEAYDNFLNVYKLNPNLFDTETYMRTETRLRERRGIKAVHLRKPKPCYIQGELFPKTTKSAVLSQSTRR